MNLSSISNRTLSLITTNLKDTERALVKSTQKIAEGSRITQSADDPAGMSVAIRILFSPSSNCFIDLIL